MNQAITGILAGILISTISAGVLWIITTVVDLDKQLAVISIKLDTTNMILQDLYESKKDK